MLTSGKLTADELMQYEGLNATRDKEGVGEECDVKRVTFTWVAKQKDPVEAPASAAKL